MLFISIARDRALWIQTLAHSSTSLSGFGIILITVQQTNPALRELTIKRMLEDLLGED